MNYPDLSEKILLVIDTDSYAGNFEREMCAYCTGVVGECEVGSRQANEFQSEFGEVMENVASLPDENGCSRPCTIVPTPGTTKYNSVGIYFDGEIPEEQIRIIKERAVEYGENRIFAGRAGPVRVLGFRIERFITTRSSEDI